MKTKILKSILFTSCFISILISNAQETKVNLTAPSKHNAAIKSGVLSFCSIGKTAKFEENFNSIQHNYNTSDKSLSAARLQTRGSIGTKESSTSLTVGANFEANYFNGYSPAQNSLAISNDGYIVSLANSNICIYNSFGNCFLSTSLNSFIDHPDITSTLHDPVVLYDSGSDRFVFTAIHGYVAENAKIVICFSTTNNPLDEWNVYVIPGDLLENNTRLLFPRIGVSTDEIFITGNLHKDSGNFDQSIILQILKINGYSGDDIILNYYYYIDDKPFTIVPASYGALGNYGPGMFFVAHVLNNFTVSLYHLTDNMLNNPSFEINSIEVPEFFIADSVSQAQSDVYLNNGDCRILSAFFLDGFIHYVFSSDQDDSGNNSINYNRLNLATLTNISSVFSLENSSCSYPSLASFTSSSNDKTVAISFLRSSPDILPELMAVSCDDQLNWSNPVTVKSWNSYVDFGESDGLAPWGAYTGIARKHNAESPTVWLAGCFGNEKLFSGSTHHCLDTWIAEINYATVSIDLNNNADNNISVFPNPCNDSWFVNIQNDQLASFEITLYNINGQKIRTLFVGNIPEGKTKLTFNKDISSGTYFLLVSKDSKLVKKQKLIITD
ncbi:MAG: hypothetical protein C0596_06645 [Marinilabiliales bacterium]|nr:MAG: hypothetical protein C0596_06645 [Marinilabiliales bacterium]